MAAKNLKNFEQTLIDLGFLSQRTKSNGLWKLVKENPRLEYGLLERQGTLKISELNLPINFDTIQNSMTENLQQKWGKSLSVELVSLSHSKFMFIAEVFSGLVPPLDLEDKGEAERTREFGGSADAPCLLLWTISLDLVGRDLVAYLGDFGCLGNPIDKWIETAIDESLKAVFRRAHRHVKSRSNFEHSVSVPKLIVLWGKLDELHSDAFKLSEAEFLFGHRLSFVIQGKKGLFVNYSKSDSIRSLNETESEQSDATFVQVSDVPFEIIEARVSGIVSLSSSQEKNGQQTHSIQRLQLLNSRSTLSQVRVDDGQPQIASPGKLRVSEKQEFNERSITEVSAALKKSLLSHDSIQANEIVKQWISTFKELFPEAGSSKIIKRVVPELASDVFKETDQKRALRALEQVAQIGNSPRILLKMSKIHKILGETALELETLTSLQKIEKRKSVIVSIMRRIVAIHFASKDSTSTLRGLDSILDQFQTSTLEELSYVLQIGLNDQPTKALVVLDKMEKTEWGLDPQNKIRLDFAIAAIWCESLRRPELVIDRLERVSKHGVSLFGDVRFDADKELLKIGRNEFVNSSRRQWWVDSSDDQKEKNLSKVQEFLVELLEQGDVNIAMKVAEFLLERTIVPRSAESFLRTLELTLAPIDRDSHCDLWLAKPIIELMDKGIQSQLFRVLKVCESSDRKMIDFYRNTEFISHCSAEELQPAVSLYQNLQLDAELTRILFQRIRKKIFDGIEVELSIVAKSDGLVPATETLDFESELFVSGKRKAIDQYVFEKFLTIEGSRGVGSAIEILNSMLSHLYETSKQEPDEIDNVLSMLYAQLAENFETLPSFSQSLLLKSMMRRQLRESITQVRIAKYLVENQAELAKEFFVFLCRSHCYVDLSYKQALDLLGEDSLSLSIWISLHVNDFPGPIDEKERIVRDFLDDYYERAAEWPIVKSMLAVLAPLGLLNINDVNRLLNYDGPSLKGRELGVDELVPIASSIPRFQWNTVVESHTELFRSYLSDITRIDDKESLLSLLQSTKLIVMTELLSPTFKLARSIDKEADFISWFERLISEEIEELDLKTLGNLLLDLKSVFGDHYSSSLLMNRLVNDSMQWKSKAHRDWILEFAVKNGIASTFIYEDELASAAKARDSERVYLAIRGLVRKCIDKQEDLSLCIDRLVGEFESNGDVELVLGVLRRLWKSSLQTSFSTAQKYILKQKIALSAFKTSGQQLVSREFFEELYVDDPKDKVNWIPLYLLRKDFGDAIGAREILKTIVPSVTDSDTSIRAYPVSLESLKKDLESLGPTNDLDESLSLLQVRSIQAKDVRPIDLLSQSQERSAEDKSLKKSKSSINSGSGILEWRRVVLSLDADPGALKSLGNLAFASETEKHVAIQAVSMLNGDFNSLEAWHWRTWRDSKHFVYPLSSSKRMPDDASVEGLKSTFAQFVYMLIPAFRRLIRKRLTLDSYLGQRGQSVSQSPIEIDLGDVLITRSGLIHFLDQLRQDKVRFYDVSQLDQEVLFEPHTNSIFLSKTHYMNSPPSHLFHRVRRLMIAHQLGALVLVLLDSSKEYQHIISRLRSIQPSKLKKWRDLVGLGNDVDVKLFKGIDVVEALHLLGQCKDVSDRAFERVKFDIDRLLLRTLLAGSLDLVGLAESLLDEDLLALQPESRQSMIRKDRRVLDLLGFSTKLKF